jgi:hypothetical protein
MEILLDNDDKKILVDTLNYATDCTYTNTVTLLNMGDHATHRFRDTFDKVPNVWKVTDISMLDTRNGQSVEYKANFSYSAMEYQSDTYKPLRTLITSQNAEQTTEDRRIIFYDGRGAIEEDRDRVLVLDLTNPKSKYGMGGTTYNLDPESGNYVSDTGEIYQGMITNDGLFDRFNMLIEQSDKMVSEGVKAR